MMVAALMTASTCGNSRMAIMSASTVAAHLDHDADVHRHRHSDEDDQHDPVASSYIWVKVWHVNIVGPRETPVSHSGVKRLTLVLNMPPQQDLGEHRREQD